MIKLTNGKDNKNSNENKDNNDKINKQAGKDAYFLIIFHGEIDQMDGSDGNDRKKMKRHTKG